MNKRQNFFVGSLLMMTFIRLYELLVALWSIDVEGFKGLPALGLNSLEASFYSVN
jgi:hypothetical protein